MKILKNKERKKIGKLGVYEYYNGNPFKATLRRSFTNGNKAVKYLKQMLENESNNGACYYLGVVL